MDPFTLIALALVAAGSGMQYAGQRKSEKAASKAYSLNQLRNRALDSEAAGQMAETIKEMAPGSQMDLMKEQAAERLAEAPTVEDFQGADYAPPSLAQGETAKVVNDQYGRELADGLSKLRRQLAFQSNLQAFGDRTFDQGIKMANRAPQFTRIANERQGWDNVLGADLAAAERKGASLKGAGDIAVGVGSIMGLAAPFAAGGASTLASQGSLASTVDAGTALSDAALGAGKGGLSMAARAPTLDQWVLKALKSRGVPLA